MNPNAALFAKWRRLLDRIFSDQLADLIVSRRHFEQLRESVQPYQGEQTGAELCRWLIQSYIAFATTAIRRMVETPSTKKGEKSLSVMVLLKDLQANHTLFTIERHRKMYKRGMKDLPNYIAVDAAENVFRDIAGNRKDKTPLKRIARDVKKLEKIRTRIGKRYVNKVVAHTEEDRRRIGKLKYEDISKAVDTLSELFTRYSLLICGNCSNPLVPLESLDIRRDLLKVWPYPKPVEPDLQELY